MHPWVQKIEQWTGITADYQMKIVWTVASVLTVLLLRWIYRRFIDRKIAEPRRHRQLRRMGNWVVTLVLVTILYRVWLGGLGSLGTFLGLVSAGIAIAMQDTIANIAGRAYILWIRPFTVGDRIEVNGATGDVIDAGLFNFTMLEVGKWVHADQSTGRIVTVPNSKVLRNTVHNYTAGFEYIWHEIEVLVTFESDWQAAKKILEKVSADMAADAAETTREQLQKSARKFAISYAKLDPVVYTRVVESGVLLTIRYLTNVRRRRLTEQQLWEAVLSEFKQRGDIDFAYPTRRFYHNDQEGKPGTGGPAASGATKTGGPTVSGATKTGGPTVSGATKTGGPAAKGPGTPP